MLLLRDFAGDLKWEPAVYAATGALTVRSTTVLCREVGKLGAKAHSAANAGVDVMYCPVQSDCPSERQGDMAIKQLSVITREDISEFWMQVAWPVVPFNCHHQGPQSCNIDCSYCYSTTWAIRVGRQSPRI